MESLFSLPTLPHAPQAKQDKGDTQQLPHIEEHAVFEIHLVLLGVLNEYAAGENHEEAKTEEEARAYLAGMATVAQTDGAGADGN